MKGFTLIELLIVVAIIGILAAISLPQYQDYLVRSRLVEEITFLDAAKISLTEAAQAGGSFPAVSPISTALPANSKYMSAVNYNVSGANASVVTTLANTGSATMNGTFMGIFGLLNADGTVTWTCGTAAAATSTVAGAVTAQYPFLPRSCQY